MSKTIAIHISFYNDRWEKVITEGIRALGYEPRFLNTDEVKLEDIADCEILFGMFPPELLAQCPNLRWMQCSFAGVDKYTKPGVFASPDVVLTNASGAYGITIAEHMIFVGTDNTTTGNWHFTFEEIGERFGVNLSEDTEMVDMITEELYKKADILSEIGVYCDEFDLTFYLNYCPYVDKEEFEDVAYDQQI